MRHAISYLSTAHIDLQENGVNEIMNEANIFNKKQDITGILLYSERNFFQLLEGEKKVIEHLYEKISGDHRHHTIIKFLDKPVFKPSFDGYMTDFVTDTKKCDEFKLQEYLHYIEVLNPESQKAIKRVIELMMV